MFTHMHPYSFLEGCKKATCHFMDGNNRSPVCLESFPGSGNTWFRGLLERVTGICTGRNYRNSVLCRPVDNSQSNGALRLRATVCSLIIHELS